MRPLVLLLLLAGSAPAAPAESLTGVDMRVAHRERRAALAEELGEGTLVLFSAPSHSYRDSRPDPNLYYLTGVTAPRAALVLRVERPHASEGSRRARALERRLLRLERDLRAAAVDAIAADTPELAREAARAATTARSAANRAGALVAKGQGAPEITETLYLPPVRRRAAVWNAPKLGAGPEAARATGIERVRDVRALFAELDKVCDEGGALHLLTRTPPAPAFAEDLAEFRSRRTDLVVVPARTAFRALRSVKHPEEVARIERACLLTTNGLHAAIQNCRPGMAEYELQAHLEFECRRGGAPRQAFSSIVGSGPNSLILHYRQNRRTFAEGEVVLMDVGGEYMGYAADVTRTFPVSGQFSDEQAEVYDVVLRAQLRAIAAVRPGATLRDVSLAARGVIAEAGYARGILHSVSHHVGLDVHDPGPGTLEAGMVITVEPGIYLADRGFGIRIEDTVVVTEDGARVLSPGVPKCRSEIELLMAADRERRQAVRGMLDRLDAAEWSRPHVPRWEDMENARWEIEDAGSDALPTILMILSDPHSPLRENAALAAAITGEVGLAALLSELGAKTAMRRRGAAFALARIAAEGTMWDESVLDALEEAVADDDPEVRGYILKAVAWAFRTEAPPHLVRALADPHPKVKRRAASEIARLGGFEDPETVAAGTEGALLALASAEDVRLRRAAVEALATVATEASLSAGLAGLLDPDGVVRGSAARVLGRIGTPPAVEALTGLLGNENPRLRRAAAHALGLTGSAAAVAPLIGALDDPEARDVAVEALGDIGPAASKALPALTKIRKKYSDDYPVRMAIEKIRGE